MTTYNVHIYREMRLVFGGIEAESHEAAAAIARDKPTDDADSIDDCEGENLAALVDVVGDEEYEESRLIDFEIERERRAARPLLAALQKASNYLADDLDESDETEMRVFQAIRSAIAGATAAGIAPEPAYSAHRVAQRLLAALEYALEFLEANDDGESDIVARLVVVRAAIAAARAADVPSPPDRERDLLHDLLELANHVVRAKDHEESVPVDIYHAAARLLARGRS